MSGREQGNEEKTWSAWYYNSIEKNIPAEALDPLHYVAYEKPESF